MPRLRLPINPTEGQLQRILALTPLRVASPPVVGPVAEIDGTRPLRLRHVDSYLCFSEVFGSRMPAQQLVQMLRGVDIVEAFGRLATIGAVLANQGYRSVDAKRLTTDVLAAWEGEVHPRAGLIGTFVSRASEERPVAHEKVIYFLQALVLLVGQRGGRLPTDQDLPLAMLAANDHLDVWEVRDPLTLSPLEKSVADFAHNSRFNHGGDHLRDVARGALLMATPPSQGPLSDPAAFERFQLAAFGARYHDYFEELVGPLYVQATQWGRRDPSGLLRLPVVRPAVWLSETRVEPEVVHRFLDGLSVTVEDARIQVCARLRPDGLPYFPTIFARTPFLKIDEGSLIPASPWVVREQLGVGAWGKARAVAKDQLGETRAWLSAFGVMFEGWCRTVARQAELTGSIRGRFVFSPSIGDASELEDIVFADGDRVALFAVKGRLMPEEAKAAVSRQRVLDWYESLLFASQGPMGRGVLRQLDRKVDRIRKGKEAGLPRDARIFPLVVTFEDLGDHMMLHRWVELRRRQEKLFRSGEVARVGAHPMAEVVQALRVSAQSINNWRTGRQTPQYHHRQNIMHLTGIIEPGEWLCPAEATTCSPE